MLTLTDVANWAKKNVLGNRGRQVLDGQLVLGNPVSVAQLAMDGEFRLVSTANGNTHLNYLLGGNNYVTHKSTSGTYFRQFASPTYTSVLGIVGTNIIFYVTKTPASAAAAGTTGTIAWDTNYIYVCVATNTWKRAALSTW